MKRAITLAAAGFTLALPSVTMGQLDPEKRQLIQLGYNQPLEGRGPISGYLFYYRNDPNFLNTNTTLRLAIAPIYMDAELGFKEALGPRTDFALGVAGGGFADSYSEVRQGSLIEEESFVGHGAEVNASVYHLFNPSQLIPLNFVFRVGPRFSLYEREDDTASNFELPEDRATLHLRTGLRWGGREPLMHPELAMEVSVWYEGQYRSGEDAYGFANDRQIEDFTHLFWTRALAIYTFPSSQQNISLSLTAGLSMDTDRFSAYRLGGVLPMISEFPLTLPGYYYQEISSRKFVLLTGSYSFPLDAGNQWNLTTFGTVAGVDYLGGFEQDGNMHSGVGAGLRYRSKTDRFQILVGYAYGFNALRHGEEGANSVGFLAQLNLEPRNREPEVGIDNPYKSRGLFRILGK